MSRNKVALVTGASSGIGAAYARVLAGQGWDLVLVARRAERLRQLAAAVEDEHRVQAQVVCADLTDAAALAEVESRLEAGGIDLLVNNAGLGTLAPFAEQQRDQHERMIALNVVAPTRLTHAALAAMRARGDGAIINVASGFAMDFIPGAAVYAATKSYVLQMSLVLAEELAGSGIGLQVLVPGLTRTELGGVGADFFEQFPPEMIMEPEALVRASLVALERGELVCIPGLADAAGFASTHAAWRAVGHGVSNRTVAARYRE